MTLSLFQAALGKLLYWVLAARLDGIGIATSLTIST